MRVSIFFNPALFLWIAFLFISCGKEQVIITDKGTLGSEQLSNTLTRPGEVPDDQFLYEEGSAVVRNPQSEAGPYSAFIVTASNEETGNRVFVFRAKDNGLLDALSTTETGGVGTGKPMPSQGSLAVSANKQYLFVVNAGSHSISSFRVQRDGLLTLIQTVSSGGLKPVSLAIHRKLLYVLNAGSDNICGFRIAEDGVLTPIPGSIGVLSGIGAGGAQVSFSPNGNYLITTERYLNKISTYHIRENGTLGEAFVVPSNGETPYGFAFAGNQFLIVSNAWRGLPEASSVTSYFLGGTQLLREVNGQVSSFQSSACWVATSRFGSYAYISNGDGRSISSYFVSVKGELSLLSSVAASTGVASRDIVVSSNNRFVYEVNIDHSIEAFQRKPRGQLQYIGKVEGLPSSASGLVAY